MNRFAVPSAVAAALVVLTAAHAADAQPKPKVARACGISAIPLTVGNQWIYESAGLPADRALTENQLKGLPVIPKQVTITVKSVDTKDGVTTVTLTEDLDGRAHETSITCTATSLVMSPNAFWFNGEPGDVFGIELTDVERKGRTFAIAAGKLDTVTPDWHDDLNAKWRHIAVGKVFPTMRTGTLGLGRRVVIQPPEAITTKAGSWKANKLGIESTLAITIEPAPLKPLREIPLLVNFMYQVDGVGVVQTVTGSAQYLLVTSKVQ